MKKILITGVHGFVGTNLVKSLGAKYEIYGLDIIDQPKDYLNKTYSWTDLENGLLPQVDVIIHLAGKAHDTKNRTESDVYFKVNTGLTQIIFDYFTKSETQKFIFFSTAKAAADSVEGILTEDVVPSPIGPYGESKIKAENYIWNHFDINGKTGKYVYVLRPCMIHGPGNKGNLNLLYSMVSHGLPWPLGSFENKRTFTSIDNLCFAIDGMISKEVISGVYNMGDDDPLSTNELVTIICEELGKKVKIWKINKSLMLLVSKICGCCHLPLNPERMQKLTENYVSSNAKIKHALNIDSFPVDAVSGLRATIRSFGNGVG